MQADAGASRKHHAAAIISVMRVIVSDQASDLAQHRCHQHTRPLPRAHHEDPRRPPRDQRPPAFAATSTSATTASNAISPALHTYNHHRVLGVRRITYGRRRRLDSWRRIECARSLHTYLSSTVARDAL